ncbi:MAG: DUF4203 domain-containing protein [Candidatus Muiribacteriota bacterium]
MNYGYLQSELTFPLAIFLLFFGLLQCFKGYKFFKIILALTGFLAAGLIAGNFVLISTTSFILGLIAFFVAGLFAAFFAVSFYFFGIFIFGASAGFLLTFILSLFMSPPIAVGLGVIVAFIGGIMAVKFQKLIIIIATSFSGAALTVNSFSYFHSTTETIIFFNYILIALLGIIVQLKDKKSSQRG